MPADITKAALRRRLRQAVTLRKMGGSLGDLFAQLRARILAEQGEPERPKLH